MSWPSEVSLKGRSEWESVQLAAADFKDAEGAPLSDFSGIYQLRFSPGENLNRKGEQHLTFGGHWQGADPVFRDLRWSVEH